MSTLKSLNFGCGVRMPEELTICVCTRIIEDEEIYAPIDARTESLQVLRELGPPDLVHLVKQPKSNGNRQVCPQGAPDHLHP